MNTPSDPLQQHISTAYSQALERQTATAPAQLRDLGYAAEDIAQASEEVPSFGCGNPTALARLQAGEVVVDLGSGAGFDGLLAGPQLGPTGRFIGVDMTPAMLERARINAASAGLAKTVEFREGTIEALPIVSSTADVVISNCVVNLSSDKPRVFSEIFRVLKPGGRIAISDIVLSAPVPLALRSVASAWVACISGALTETEVRSQLDAAGFVDVDIELQPLAGMLDQLLEDPIVAALAQSVGRAALESMASTVHSGSISAIRP